ncbi:MAG: hypothetical protein AB1498_02685 [bacterium]
MGKKTFRFCLLFLINIGLVYASGEKEGIEKLQTPAVISSKQVKSVKLGGKLEIRYEDPQSKAGTLKMYKFEPFVEAEINDNITMKGQVFFGTEKTEVNDGWIQYKKFPLVGGSLKAGRFRRKSFGLPQDEEGRVSIDYSLTGRAFTGDRQVGLEYSGSFGSIVNINMGMFNGSLTGDREAGEVDTASTTAAKFVADKSGNTDTNQNKDIAVRVTVNPLKGLQAGGSFLSGKLSPADISKINGYTAASYTSDKKERMSGDIMYKSNIFDFKAEYIQGKTSDLKVNSWYSLVILKGVFDEFDIYARYSELRPDIDLNEAKSYTWRLYQTTTGLIWNLNSFTKLQGDYDFNHEGLSSKIKNDILRVRWITNF